MNRVLAKLYFKYFVRQKDKKRRYDRFYSSKNFDGNYVVSEEFWHSGGGIIAELENAK